VIHPANIAADQELMARTRAEYAMSRPYGQALKAFERPVGIVCGRDDHWVGWQDSVRLCQAFRRVRWDVLPDCGHLLPFEQPDRFRALVADWLTRV
jgi:pimeloyl-ACP methyl ester carboxylesterase